MASSIPTDPTALHRVITEFEVGSASDMRFLVECCRILTAQTMDTIGAAEWNARQGVILATGDARRAKRVTRPFWGALSHIESANKRVVAVWKTFLKECAEEMGHARPATKKKFEWK
jgi:hypothetical protein